MRDATFPERPHQATLRSVAEVELVVHRPPLAPIRELLSITIHDVVNDGRFKRLVLDFYRISRRIENEAWLRAQVRRLA